MRLALALASVSALSLIAAAPARAQCVEAPSGTFTCTGSDTGGIEDNSDGVSVTVQPGADVTVDDGDAVRVRGDNVIVHNDGTIETTDPDGDDGIDADDGDGLTVVNTGTIRARDRGIDAEDKDNVRVTNSGIIDALDDGIKLDDGADATLINTLTGVVSAGSEGFEAGDGAFVRNDGTIDATEDAIQIGERGTILNTGFILSDDIDPETGLTNPGTDPTGDGIDIDSGLIVNTGVIDAVDGDGVDYDESAFVGANDTAILNSGLISGLRGVNVDPANTSPQFILTDGQIVGTEGTAIFTGAGADGLAIFDTLAGLDAPGGLTLGSVAPVEIIGNVDLGAGDDNVSFETAGRNAMIYDGVFDGTFNGGAGNDTAIFTATLHEFVAASMEGETLVLAFSDGVSSQTLRFAGIEHFVFEANPFATSPDEVGGLRFSADRVAQGPAALIPLPAGVWMLGAALLGLVGLRRR